MQKKKQTQEKISDGAIKESETRYRRLFETAEDGILILDGNTGEITNVNPFLMKMLGYSREEFLGKKLWEIGSFKNIEASRTAFRDLQKKKYIRYEDLPLETKDGRRMDVEFVSNVYLVDDKQVIQCNIRDITERVRVEEALRMAREELETRVQERTGELAKANEALQADISARGQVEAALKNKVEDLRRLATVVSDSNDAVIMHDLDGKILAWNRGAIETYGYTEAEALGKNVRDIVAEPDREAALTLIQKIKQGEIVKSFELRRVTKDGRILDVWLTTTLLTDEKGQPVAIATTERDITERKQAEETLKKLSGAVEQTADNVFITDREGVIEYVNPAFEQLTGYLLDEAAGKTPRILKSGMQSAKEYAGLWATILAGKVFQNVVINRKKNGELYYEERTITPLLDRQGNITHFVSTGKDITERMQREREMEAVATVSAALRAAQTLDEMLPLLLDVTLGVLHTTQGAIWLYDPAKDELRTAVTRGWNEGTGGAPILPEKPGEGINGYVFATGQPYVASDFHLDLRLPETARQRILPGIGGATIPIRAGDNVIGTFNVNVALPLELTPGEIHLLNTLSEIAGNAIQRTRLHEKTRRDAQRFAALHSIDLAISASTDMRMTLDILLGHVVDLLNVSAADVLLFNPHMQTLEYSAGKGFRSSAIKKSHLHLGEGYAGRAVLERRTLNAADLLTLGSNFARKELLAGEEFVAYFGVPLITKGKAIGVLDIFNRSPLAPNSEWLDFMEALASQAAIAIDSATLFEDLQHSIFDLSLAYDATIEGWSRAMDLRDKETEGHTQRVADLTVQLARMMGMSEDKIVHIRRGALLHDMGKMGVPDSILLKPGPLTDEEWIMMRRHPQFAYDMLSPIAYLHPALDIPYCHHEKWDGTGYPRGLKGEEIPLAARIFALADVWDALTSDRPYRKAWPKEKVREHIRAGSGTHFDPQMVEAFLKTMRETR